MLFVVAALKYTNLKFGSSQIIVWKESASRKEYLPEILKMDSNE